MIVMDNIYGLEEEEKLVGSKFAANMWIRTICVLCEGRESTQETQEYLKQRMLFIMLSANRVCEEAFEGHEWVSELTISMQEEEVLVDLDYELENPCVVQWIMPWFSAPSRVDPTFDGDGIKIVKYHEVVTVGLPKRSFCPLRFSHSTSVHVEIEGCGFVQTAELQIEMSTGRGKLG